jgi:hypothetical protein
MHAAAAVPKPPHLWFLGLRQDVQLRALPGVRCAPISGLGLSAVCR